MLYTHATFSLIGSPRPRGSEWNARRTRKKRTTRKRCECPYSFHPLPHPSHPLPSSPTPSYPLLPPSHPPTSLPPSYLPPSPTRPSWIWGLQHPYCLVCSLSFSLIGVGRRCGTSGRKRNNRPPGENGTPRKEREKRMLHCLT